MADQDLYAQMIALEGGVVREGEVSQYGGFLPEDEYERRRRLLELMGRQGQYAASIGYPRPAQPQPADIGPLVPGFGSYGRRPSAALDVGRIGLDRTRKLSIDDVINRMKGLGY